MKNQQQQQRPQQDLDEAAVDVPEVGVGDGERGQGHVVEDVEHLRLVNLLHHANFSFMCDAPL